MAPHFFSALLTRNSESASLPSAVLPFGYQAMKARKMARELFRLTILSWTLSLGDKNVVIPCHCNDGNHCSNSYQCIEDEFNFIRSNRRRKKWLAPLQELHVELYSYTSNVYLRNLMIFCSFSLSVFLFSRIREKNVLTQFRLEGLFQHTNNARHQYASQRW